MVKQNRAIAFMKVINMAEMCASLKMRIREIQVIRSLLNNVLLVRLSRTIGLERLYFHRNDASVARSMTVIHVGEVNCSEAEYKFENAPIMDKADLLTKRK